MIRSSTERFGTAFALYILASAAGAEGQVLARNELALQGARQVIAAAMAEAKRLAAPGGVIAVVDAGGHLMALERIDGTFPAGANISAGKARTAVLFKKPTKFFEDIINKGRTAMTTLPDFTPLQGGVPILSGGEVVGGVGVSGAASAQQDEEIAIAGAAALGDASAAAGPPPVSYYQGAEVAKAFAKGAVLFDGAGRNYMVHASRRDRAGQAEVHSLDTDVIYVLDGSATFVTGGTVAGGKEIEPNEVRGAAIDGGEVRQIAKGDVLIVPKGTPHWFKEVPAVLTYYVVKIR